ncbi:hypothetical protein J6590_104361, partial [Homalodisca vitripennis]
KYDQKSDGFQSLETKRHKCLTTPFRKSDTNTLLQVQHGVGGDYIANLVTVPITK